MNPYREDVRIRLDLQSAFDLYFKYSQKKYLDPYDYNVCSKARQKDEIINIMSRNNISEEIIKIIEPFIENPCLQTFTPIQNKYNLQKDLW